MYLSCKETVIIFIVHIFFFRHGNMFVYSWLFVILIVIGCCLFSDSAIDQGSDGRQRMCGEVRHWEVFVPVLLEVWI